MLISSCRFIPNNSTQTAWPGAFKLALLLMGFKSLWEWCFNTITDSLDTNHRPVLYLKQQFGDRILPPSSGEKPTLLDPVDRACPYLQINLGLWRPCLSSAVRRWLPTAAARVRVRAACGVCGGQSGTGAGFLRVLRFPLPIIPPISPLS
jgi:hypothetical protein